MKVTEYPYHLRHLEDDYDLVLGKIDNYKPDRERRFCIYLGLNFESGGFHHCFGGHVLTDYIDGKEVGSAAGMDYILSLMNVLDVDDLNKAVGKMVYAIYPKNRNFNDSTVGIAQINLNHVKDHPLFLVGDWRQRWGLEEDS